MIVLALALGEGLFVGIPALAAVLFKPIVETARYYNLQANREAAENGEE